MSRVQHNHSPSTEQTLAFPWRFRLLLLGFVMSLALLLGYTCQLNHGQGVFLRDQGLQRAVGDLSIPAYRGTITDRNGQPLAVSTQVVSLGINPQVLGHQPQYWPQLALALHTTSDELAQWLAKYAHKQFVFWRRHMEPQVAESILAMNIPGVSGRTEYKRYYPAAEVTSHLLGFTNIDDQGQEGVELAYDHILAGAPGQASSVRDRRGRVVDMWQVDRAPKVGQDLALTIDLRMQYLAYRALARAVSQHQAKGGTLVALDIKSGQVLAMTNQPAFNPNYRAHLEYDRVRNRAVTDVFEPGSTVKPFTVAAAMMAGTHEAYTPIETSPGMMQVSGKQIRDLRNYGLIDVQTVLAKSSNIGVAKIALSMSPSYLTGFYQRLGLGESTDLLLPGERNGFMPMKNRWSDIEQATLSYGYGVSVTALQLAQAYAVIANQGKKSSLSILARGSVPQTSESVLEPSVAMSLSAILESVTGEAGTAQRARVPGYRVAGKTGTVHKVGSSGYVKDQYLALFAGFAPVSDPQVAIVVMVDEPSAGQYYGGIVAAPVFAETMGGVLRLMGTPMDDLQVPDQDQYFAQAQL